MVVRWECIYKRLIDKQQVKHAVVPDETFATVPYLSEEQSKPEQLLLLTSECLFLLSRSDLDNKYLGPILVWFVYVFLI